MPGVLRFVLVGVNDVLLGLRGLFLDIKGALDSPWHLMELIHIHDLDVINELWLLVDIGRPRSLVQDDAGGARIVRRVGLQAPGDRVGELVVVLLIRI